MTLPCLCPHCGASYTVTEENLGRSVRCARCTHEFVLDRARSAGAAAPGSEGGRDSPSSTATGLILRVQANEPPAWERLVDLYAPLVYRWCRWSGLQPDDAADVVQEVFAAVAKRICEFRRDRPGDSFHAWLSTITRHKVQDHFRRLRGRPQAEGGTDALERLAQVPDPLADASEPEGQVSEQDFLALRAADLVRAEVEDRTWQAFWRVAVGGEDTAQVAADLGMNVRAVYEAKYRVRRRIREQLDDLT